MNFFRGNSISIAVVIAEDDPVSRKLVTTVIEMGGFRTIVTNDGDEALSALRAQKKPCIAGRLDDARNGRRGNLPPDARGRQERLHHHGHGTRH